MRIEETVSALNQLRQAGPDSSTENELDALESDLDGLLLRQNGLQRETRTRGYFIYQL